MPEVAKNQDLTAQDLRVIINGLRLSGFADVEPEALDQIRFKIKQLPNPEALNDLIGSPNELKKVAAQIGEIMRLLEIYRKKGAEFKARFESQKGMPPRYKVLEWRNANMNNTDFVRQVIKLSAIADSKGHGDVATKLNTLAKNTLDEKQSFEDVKEAVTALSSIHMDKEAQGLKNLWQGFKNVRQEAADLKTLTQIQQGIWQARQQLEQGIKSFRASINNVNKMVASLVNPQRKSMAQQIANQFNIQIEGDEDVFGDTKATEAQLNQMIQDARQYANVGSTPAPAAPAGAPAAPAAAAPAAGGTPSAAPAAAPAAPSGIPSASSPATAARFVDYLSKLLTPKASSVAKIVLAQASDPEDQAFQAWVSSNKDKPEVLQQALAHYKQMAGETAAPSRGVPETNLLGSDAGKAPVAAPAAPAAETPPAGAPPAGAPAAETWSSGDIEADKFLKSLKKVPGTVDQFTGPDGTQYRINKANGKLSILKRIA